MVLSFSSSNTACLFPSVTFQPTFVVCLPASAWLAVGVITAKWGSLVSPVVEEGTEVFLQSNCKHLI